MIDELPSGSLSAGPFACRHRTTAVVVVELRELKRRNLLLEHENEVLRRAAAYLSQAQLRAKGSTCW